MTTITPYFMVMVADMDRAVAFYRDALDANVGFASPDWSSLTIGGVMIGLHGGGDGTPRAVGLGFDIDDLDAVCAAIEKAGGTIVSPPVHKPEEGITLGEARDTEGNVFSITLAGHT
jgi:predicted enzyme related to lactoylglutathione lyase